MLRLRVVALASSLGFTLAVNGAWAQETPPPAPVVVEEQPATPTVEVNTPAPNVEVHTPPPTIVTQPAPAPAPVIIQQPAPVVEERPVNVNISMPARTRNMSVMLGGGVSNFTNETLQNRTGIQGAYDARLVFGLRSPIAFEAAYVGTAGEVDTLGLDDDAVLISNGAEGLARINFGTGMAQPYLVGGGSWVRYNVVNSSFNTSDVRSEDDVFALPVGAGISGYLGNGLVLDGRFVFRATFEDELLRSQGDDSNLNNWLATLRLGYSF
jgi:hypothetical protein